jgi:hypothetical protein
LLRRKTIYEQLHPEARQGAAPGKAGGGKVAKGVLKTPFAQDTAAKTGVAIRAIQKDVQIAARITPEVKALIRNTPLADEKAETRRPNCCGWPASRPVTVQLAFG